MSAGRSVETCSTCRGSGWAVITRDGVEQAAPCPDCHVLDLSTRLLEQARIPPRYAGCALNRDFYFHNELQERALKRSVDYVEAFPDVPRGLLFSGPCGVGKTHLSVAILKSLIQEKQVRGRFVDETELLRRLQYSYARNAPETEREVITPLLEADLLVWDDLGAGRPTEWVRETIRTILNNRYTYNRQTILSTNCPLEASTRGELARDNTLAEQIGRRLHSRIMEMCELVRITGPDFRTEIRKAGLDFEEKSRG